MAQSTVSRAAPSTKRMGAVDLGASSKCPESAPAHLEWPTATVFWKGKAWARAAQNSSDAQAFGAVGGRTGILYTAGPVGPSSMAIMSTARHCKPRSIKMASARSMASRATLPIRGSPPLKRSRWRRRCAPCSRPQTRVDAPTFVLPPAEVGRAGRRRDRADR